MSAWILDKSVQNETWWYMTPTPLPFDVTVQHEWSPWGSHIFRSIKRSSFNKGMGGKKQTQGVYLMFLMGNEKLKMGFRFICRITKKTKKKNNTCRSPDMMKSKSWKYYPAGKNNIMLVLLVTSQLPWNVPQYLYVSLCWNFTFLRLHFQIYVDNAVLDVC